MEKKPFENNAEKEKMLYFLLSAHFYSSMPGTIFAILASFSLMSANAFNLNLAENFGGRMIHAFNYRCFF